ncbi:MAG: abortive infection system antitoxin AbiGi family protein [Bacteroidota bacterium]
MIPLISSRTLFHFTCSRAILNKILSNNFFPRYCLETYELTPAIEISRAFPMVCFCDLPLSQIKNHLKTYGYYGIGMSKEWGIRKGLNPVLYLQRDSMLSRQLGSMSPFIENSPLPIGQSDQEIRSAEIFRHVKPYEGTLIRCGKRIPNVTFYDEREWRYLPDPLTRDIPFSLDPSDYNTQTRKDQANQDAESHPLRFQISDINYIFIKDETEVLDILRDIQEIKGSRYSADQVRVLTSKIMTSEKLLNDI